MVRTLLRWSPFVAVAFALTNASISGQQPGPLQGARATVSVQATDARDLRTWDSFVTSGARSGLLRLTSLSHDPLLPTRSVERYEQLHDGLRIWGADIIRDSQDGVPISIFGMLAPDLSLSTQPAIAAINAGGTLLRAGGADASLLTRPELVIVHLDATDYRLAYTAAVAGADDVFQLFVDANSGGELWRYSRIETASAVGTGTGVLGDKKKLAVDSSNGGFVAFDRLRPPVLQTYDMRGNLARMKLLDRGLASYSASDLATDADNIWTDVAVVDAHAHVGLTYDFYFKRFGRTGLDNRNSPLNIVTNAVSQQGALSLPVADQGYAINASWCDVCGPGGQGRMFFGNGIPPGFFVTSTGENFTYFAGGLDVTAHELTHGVTSATSGLIYYGESGALNEAFSDMMGKAAEFFYHPAGGGVGQADYVLGKDIARAVRPGSLNGLRDMGNPGAFGDPDFYSRRFTGTTDNAGVHTNSGIANHAYYLAIEGGTNRTSGLSVQGVGAANREQIEKVFYRAFTLLLPANATFLVARGATIQAARDLYGSGSAAERAVTQAWAAVGVPDIASVTSATSTIAPGRFTTLAYTATATGRLEVNLSWNAPQATDLDLYLTREGCAPTLSACILARSEGPATSESVSFTVRAGERYWLNVNNFEGPSTAFVLQVWVNAGVN